MKKQRIIITIVSFLLLVLIIPITLLSIGLGMPSQYGKTYYAQLALMYEKLKSTQGKKVVLVGNSAVAFGVDSALLEGELKGCGAEYEVVNFGLYGALGTKLMMELSESYIGEEDIVIFMPEPYEQGMSTYFSARETWRCLDENLEMITCLPFAEQRELIGDYSAFVAEKYRYMLEGGAEGSAVYASASFDENGDLKKYERKQNVMQGGYDDNWAVKFDQELLNDEFVVCVNEYIQTVRAVGAEIYYCLVPVNASSVVSDTTGDIDTFCGTIYEKLNLTTLGDPHDSILSAEWFYDSNFHLNDAGMTVYTAMLAEAIKTKLEITTPSGIQIPAMPELPKESVQGVGDNTHAEYFTYEETSDGSFIIIGLTEQGKKQESLIVPYAYNGKTVTGFSVNTFANNVFVREITLQTNIMRISDDSFKGCTSLKKLILKHEDASMVGIGASLLSGADICKIYVPAKALSNYKNNYFWGYYASKLVAQSGENE